MDKRRNRISSLATSDNSGHKATVLRTSAQISLRETSYVRRTLGDIAERFKKMTDIFNSERRNLSKKYSLIVQCLFC